MREFSVWAPKASEVVLVLEESATAMVLAERGWWHVCVGCAPEAAYAFSLDEGDPRPDPQGLRLPHGPHGWSQLFDPGEFGWTDGAWSGVDLEGAVIYELHVGTFTPQGTLDSVIDRLDHLADLGVTIVELMPVSPFPGHHGWGYDGVAPFAVHEPYGGPAALQRFVDAAHDRGLGVCLDVVYNHLGPEGNYLGEFGPYLTDTHETPWGLALNLDASGSDQVRRWLLDNVVQWLRDFHIDALRLDAVHELHDEGEPHILEEMSREVDALADQEGRRLWLIAESDRNDPCTVVPRAPKDGPRGGLGLHAQWADDVHHALHVTLTGETQGHYSDFEAPDALAKVMATPFFHDGSWSSFRGRTHGRPLEPGSVPAWRFVASLQTHDQVGNRAVGDRLTAVLPPGMLACGAAILLTSPWTPMLFMGEEWGASTPWQYFTDHTDPRIRAAVSEGRASEFASHGWDPKDVPDPQSPQTYQNSKLDWTEVARDPHARLLAWYRDLIRLRREHPDLCDGRLDRVDVDHDRERGLFRMRRGDCQVVVNLSDRVHVLDVDGAVLLSWEPGTKVTNGVVELSGQSVVILWLRH